MIVKRRFPNFFSGFESTEHQVSTLDELLEIDWIKAYDDIPNHLGMYYSPKSGKSSPDLLMSLVRGEDGKVIFFVVGYIFGDARELGLEDYNNIK
jgi:hypothetical protein